MYTRTGGGGVVGSPTHYAMKEIPLEGPESEDDVKVCCSVLQCVAVCCSVLQCVAVCCSVLQCAVG